jgi:hypothetical protein
MDDDDMRLLFKEAQGVIAHLGHWLTVIRERGDSQFGIPTVLPSGRSITGDLLEAQAVIRGLIIASDYVYPELNT